MTTREDLIDGFRTIIREGRRAMAGFAPDDWSRQVHDEEGGWTVRQLFAHLTATADIVPGFVGALSQTPAGQDMAASLDINAFNAQQIAAREALSESELADAFQGAHERLIEFVQAMPEEQLNESRRFRTLDGPVADIMATTLLLHGLSHIYTTVRPAT